MVNASAKWTDYERFIGTASSGHAIIVDAGKDKTGNGPMELVLIGLCSCTATDVVSILRKKREPFTAIEVHASAECAPEAPTVYTHIKLTYKISGKVNRKAVEDAVQLSKEKYCSVSQMLRHSAEITSEIVLDD